MTQSFNNRTVDQVSLTLARRQVGLRHNLIEPLEKTAEGNWLSDVGDQFRGWFNKRNPVAQKAMIGAGLGGAMGLGSGLLGDDERGEKRPWRDALTGALAGGALGGGIGMLNTKDRESLLDTSGVTTPTDPEAIEKMQEKIKNFKELQSQTEKPWLLNQANRLGEAAQNVGERALSGTGALMAEHPVATGAGVLGAANIGEGLRRSHQMRNISPAQMQRVAEYMSESPANLKQVEDQFKAVLQKLPSGTVANTPALQKRRLTEIMTLLRTDEGRKALLKRSPIAPQLMQSLKPITGIKRQPMTYLQSLNQTAARTKRNPLSWNPATWLGAPGKAMSHGPKSYPRALHAPGRLLKKPKVAIPAAILSLLGVVGVDDYWKRNNAEQKIKNFQWNDGGVKPSP